MPTLQSLESSGYIKEFSHSMLDVLVYEITYKGLHIIQHAVWAIIQFLLTSIAVPIFVAIITTWATLKVFGQA